MRSTLRAVGNDLAVVIPDAMVQQLGLARDVEISVEDDAVVLRKPKRQLPASAAADRRGRTADGVEAAVYRLKITLRHVEPKVWRRIEVLGDTTLPRLHRIIQIAMGWDDAHLHAFKIGALTYGTPDPYFDLQFVSERGVRLQHVITAAKQRFAYEYDFGDGWMHDIVVESIRPMSAPTHYPKFLAGENACPPEDVGGPPGYEAFLDIFDDPAHEEHARMVEWVGGRFNPVLVDVSGIEEAFARLAARAKAQTSTKQRAGK